jgi:diaminohydroxyphosphoribosylaminopyrimidine deaminase/5-amino-6-(5-phosphoribosylamino)uracil reductase
MPHTPQEIMNRALGLAARGKGLVEPNPMVGAVVAKDGRIIGEGYHAKFGEAHAEVHALEAAGKDAEGATLYVTLEPCCHHGKTPPCTKAIMKAGVTKVVAAMKDPNRAVFGKGLEELQTAGIEVECGLLEPEARHLNAPYIKLTTKGIPFFIAKWAMSLDGKVSTRTGESQWITCETAREEAHRLRSTASAVMVGAGTALADDPLLTCRIPGGRNPVRIIVDSTCRLDPASRLVQSIEEAPIIIATTEAAPSEKLRRLEQAGCTMLSCPAKHSRVDLGELAGLLGKRMMTTVLIEGGSELLGSAFDEGLIDRAAVFVAPKLIGGREAGTPLAGKGLEKIAEAYHLRNVTIKNLDCDILIEGDLFGGTEELVK